MSRPRALLLWGIFSAFTAAKSALLSPSAGYIKRRGEIDMLTSCCTIKFLRLHSGSLRSTRPIISQFIHNTGIMTTPTAIPVVVCGMREEIGRSVGDALRPEYERKYTWALSYTTPSALTNVAFLALQYSRALYQVYRVGRPGAATGASRYYS